MDNIWERSIPFYDLQLKELEQVITEYDHRLDILDFYPINVGCRNSNFKVSTNNGYLLLRICPLYDTRYKKERIISESFYEHIKVPKLLYISEINITQRTCLIYEYIHGISMQEYLLQVSNPEEDIIAQVAKSAAYIHSSDIIFNDEDCVNYPPFLTWYDMFLDKELVIERLGRDVHNRVKALINNKKVDLCIIDTYSSFIHSDFRPANMLIDKSKKVWIVDWEFSGYGHSLADIGQFFRYSNYFKPKHTKLFEEEYNCYSKRTLPPDWYNLCKLRDLVNPLQMLGAKENLPQKYVDLKKLVMDTCNYFGY